MVENQALGVQRDRADDFGAVHVVLRNVKPGHERCLPPPESSVQGRTLAFAARARERLTRLGFRMTPYAEHMTPARPGAPPAPAGSANRCIMLERGYLEILTPTGETPVGRELSAGIDRYVGVHLLAFSAHDAERERGRLAAAGFAQQPLVDLRRDGIMPDGSAIPLRWSPRRT